MNDSYATSRKSRLDESGRGENSFDSGALQFSDVKGASIVDCISNGKVVNYKKEQLLVA